MNCSISPAPPLGCDQSPRSTDIFVHLLAADASTLGAEPDSLGFAAQPESGQFGSYAVVFHARVKRVRFAALKESALLGHAIAHEIGHVLLGVGGHAPSGIMKASWGRSELQRAADGKLVFSGHERRRIQANIRSRFASSGTRTHGPVT